MNQQWHVTNGEKKEEKKMILEKRNYPPSIPPLNGNMMEKSREATLLWKYEGSSVYAVYRNTEDMCLSIPAQVMKKLRDDEISQWMPEVDFADLFIIVRKVNKRELVIFQYWFSTEKLDIMRTEIPQFIQGIK